MKNFYTGLFILFITSCTQLFAQSGIYVGGHFRRERTHTINDLKASGFTYVILFNIQVEANGDLTTDGEKICSNGTYVFGNTSPDYASDVASLKTGVSSINRVESCIGGWGNTGYTNIKNIVNAQGTGTGSILYKNFKALKTAIPSMDAINNDDESTYDVNTATAFHVMLADLGFKTTLAPYMNKGFWQSLATNVNNQRNGAVDKIYLQVYDGGAGNNPCDWNINNIEMHTGDLYYENGTTVTNKMINAKNNCGSKGGFIWVYNDNNINLKDQASRINTIFNIKTKNTQEVANFFKDCGNGLFTNGLGVDNYTTAELQALGINNNDISSLTVMEGFEVVLYDGDNFTGASTVITSDNDCLVAAGWNDRASSVKVRTAGVTDMAGTYYLLNKNSGLSMDLSGGVTSVSDGDNIQQWSFNGNGGQKFVFSHLGEGTYKIIVQSSGKSLDVDAISKNDGANVQQWTYLGSFNQQFVLIATGGGHYKIIPKHSGKLVEVEGGGKTAGNNVRQWTNKNQASGEWKLIHTNDVPVVNITSPLNNASVNEPGSFSITATATDAETSVTKVEFFNGTTKLGEDVTSPYTYNWTTIGDGTYAITAKATNLVNGTATSSVITVKVNKAPVVSITAPAGNAQFSVLETITLKANANDSDGNVSKVEFFSGTTKLGEGLTAPYIFAWSGMAAGTYSITAKATDNQGFAATSAAITVKVSNVPVVSITSPVNNVSYSAPASVLIKANATDADGTIAKVEFFDGTTKLGEDAISPYTFDWIDVIAGTYMVTAKATDNLGYATTSAAVKIIVSPTTDVTDIEQAKSVIVYPNPTTGIVNLPVATSAVEVFNINGQALPVHFTAGSEMLDISALPAGVYILKIENPGAACFERILKIN